MPFNIGVSVVGDIAIGVWFGHHNLGQRIHGRPSLSYAFHTAFLSAETMRVSLPSLDISNKGLFPASKATNFFMDVTLEDTDSPPTAECASGLICSEILSLSLCRDVLRSYLHTASSPQAMPKPVLKMPAAFGGTAYKQGIVLC